MTTTEIPTSELILQSPIDWLSYCDTAAKGIRNLTPMYSVRGGEYRVGYWQREELASDHEPSNIIEVDITADVMAIREKTKPVVATLVDGFLTRQPNLNEKSYEQFRAIAEYFALSTSRLAIIYPGFVSVAQHLDNGADMGGLVQELASRFVPETHHTQIAAAGLAISQVVQPSQSAAA